MSWDDPGLRRGAHRFRSDGHQRRERLYGSRRRLPYNVAIGLGRLGRRVGFFGRLSNDPFGRMLLDRLVADRVDCSQIVRGSEPTALAIVHLARGEEPQFRFYGEAAADCMLTLDDAPASAALEQRVHALHFGSISLIREPGASVYEWLMRRESGHRVLSLDPNVRPGFRDRRSYSALLERLVALADIIKVSRADLAWLYPDRHPMEVAADWLGRGPSLVVLTKGEDGATGMTSTAIVDVPAPAVTIRDTVGAGDAFTAGLLGSLDERGLLEPGKLRELARDDLVTCLSYANRVAAITCTRSGAEPPGLEEVVTAALREDR